MLTTHFLSLKISPSIDLKKAAAAFRISAPESWEDCVILEEPQLSEMYMMHMPCKKVYLFAYGCIVFENFKADETGKFLKNIRLIIGELDYKMLARYSESYTMQVQENLKDQKIQELLENQEIQGLQNIHENQKIQELQKVQENQENQEFQKIQENQENQKNQENQEDCPDGSLSYVIAVVLAKSSALSKEEANIGLLLDEAEIFIDKLQTAALDSGTRKSTKTMSHIIRFEHESAAAIKLFDRPAKVSGNLALRKFYDDLANRFELEDRYEVLEKKVSELRNIVRSYAGLRNNRQEKRLLFFEIFLLILFPLFRLAEFFLQRLGIENVFNQLFIDLLQKLNIFF